LTSAQGALSLKQKISEIDVAILGVNNAAQLSSNLEDFSAVQKHNLDFSPFAVFDEKMVNPSMWNLK
jgi:hypothetical protein